MINDDEIRKKQKKLEGFCHLVIQWEVAFDRYS